MASLDERKKQPHANLTRKQVRGSRGRRHRESQTDKPVLKQGFGSMSAVRIAGISYRQLDHWASQGLVRPSLAEAVGSGSRRLYSYSDLVTLRAIKRLLDAGFRLAKIRSIIHNLDSEFDTDLASSNLVIDGGTPVLVTSDDELFDLLRNGQGVLNVLPMVSVQQEVDASIVELFPTAAPGLRRAGDSDAHAEDSGGTRASDAA